VGDRQAEAQCNNALAVMYCFDGDYSKALATWEKARVICRDIDLRPVEAQVMANIGVAYRVLGCCRQASEYLEQGLALAQAVGFRTIQPDAMLNLGLCRSALGQHERALRLVTDALALAREVRYTELAVRSLNALAQIHLARGEGKESAVRALECATESLDTARAADLRPGQALAHSLSARACQALGQLDQALAASAQAMDLFQEGAGDGVEEQICYHHAQILCAAGRLEEARAAYERAQSELLAKADRLDDADLRRCYLQDVPLNREITERASRNHR
jgi:tetratricopeptide (TPR) repeat protein